MSPIAQDALSWTGIVVAGMCALYTVSNVARLPLSDAPSWLHFTLISVIATPYFLPHMHERYFYLADMLSVIYGFYVPRHWYIPIIVVLSSFISYSAFLSREIAWFAMFYNYADVRVASLLMFFALFSLIVGPPTPSQPDRVDESQAPMVGT